jgi:hypothetical protein
LCSARSTRVMRLRPWRKAAAAEAVRGAEVAKVAREVGPEVAVVLGGVPPGKLRSMVTGFAQMFEMTKEMVPRTTWVEEDVLPALQTQLTTGVQLLGQSMVNMLVACSGVKNGRARA